MLFTLHITEVKLSVYKLKLTDRGNIRFSEWQINTNNKNRTGDLSKTDIKQDMHKLIPKIIP